MERRAFLALAGAAAASVLAGCLARPKTTPSPSASASNTPRLTTPSPTPTPTPVRDPLPAGVARALFIGTDAREEGSFGGRSDTIVYAQLSEDRTHLTLVSFARDTWVAIGGGHGKINSSFSSGGTPLLTATVSALLGGVDIPIVAQTNFSGFIAMTRWLEGITVFNRVASSTTVNSTGRVVDFPEGEIKLENTDALIYARQRKELPNGDLDRTERHRALLIGMAKGLQLLAKIPSTFNSIGKSLFQNAKVTGALVESDIPDLINPLLKIDPSKAVSLMAPVSGYDMINGQSVNILDQARHDELVNALNTGPDAINAYVEKYGTSNAPTGG